MNNGNGTHNYNNFILPVALITGMIYGVSIPAFADPDRPAYVISNNTTSSLKTSKADRMQALKYAEIAFENATVAGGETAAPYEYYMAEAYLKIAKEEFGEGDQIGVIPISGESEKYALMAIEKAKGVSQ